MTATLHSISRLFNISQNLHTPLAHHLILFPLVNITTIGENNLRKKEKRVLKMALQAPAKSIPLPSSLAPTSNAGLRRPSDTFALKSSFFSPSVHLLLPAHLRTNAPATAPKFSMRVASKQAYICRDCGYIYNDRTPFEKLPDSYFCPVCGAPKRRFRPYEPKVAKDANDSSIRKARKEQMKRDEAIGRALPIGIVVGIAALGGLYFYLNNTF